MVLDWDKNRQAKGWNRKTASGGLFAGDPRACPTGSKGEA